MDTTPSSMLNASRLPYGSEATTLFNAIRTLRELELGAARNWQQNNCETLAGIGVVSVMVSISTRMLEPLVETLVRKN